MLKKKKTYKINPFRRPFVFCVAKKNIVERTKPEIKSGEFSTLENGKVIRVQKKNYGKS